MLRIRLFLPSLSVELILILSRVLARLIQHFIISPDRNRIIWHQLCLDFQPEFQKRKIYPQSGTFQMEEKIGYVNIVKQEKSLRFRI